MIYSVAALLAITMDAARYPRILGVSAASRGRRSRSYRVLK